MWDAVVTAIVLLAALAAFVTEVYPLAVTALAGATALVLTGVLTFPQAFAGFASEAVMMVAGMLIIGQAMVSTGLVEAMGRRLRRLTSAGEAHTVAALGTTSALASALLSNTAVVAAILPVLDSLKTASCGRLVPRRLALGVGAAAVLGGNLTLTGSTPQIVAHGLLQEADLPGLGYFTLLPLALPLVMVTIAYYATIGRRLVARIPAAKPVMTSPTAPPCPPAPHAPRAKQVITIVVFVACVVGFITQLWPIGATAIAGALLLIIT